MRSIRNFFVFFISGLTIFYTSCLDSQKNNQNIVDNKVHIIANDAGYEYPDCILAGMSHIIFENHGSEIHEVMFVKLSEGMTGKNYLDEVASGISFPEGAIDYSGPGLVSSGGKVEMWLTLDPGNYLLACWFKGHLETLKPYTMTVLKSGKKGITPPKEDVTLKMIDFRFELDGILKKGDQVIKVETVGPTMHEVDFFRLHDGKTIEDIRQWQKQGKNGQPPGTAIGGILDNHDISRIVWLKTNFEPGRYVLWCGMAMVPDSNEPGFDVTHADAGMFKELLIQD